jgi:hypothetical protein
MLGPFARLFSIPVADRLDYILKKLDGGEGGIRTPDSLTTMPDFESGAFNRALPPLRCLRLSRPLTLCLIGLRFVLPQNISPFQVCPSNWIRIREGRGTCGESHYGRIGGSTICG